MSAIDGVLLFWLVPALVTFLLLIQCERKESNTDPENYKTGDWQGVIVFSVIYPIGAILMLVGIVIPWLIKERSLTKED